MPCSLRGVCARATGSEGAPVEAAQRCHCERPGGAGAAGRCEDMELRSSRPPWSWHLPAAAPRDPREMLAGRSLLAAAPFPWQPLPSPTPTPGETKAGAAAGGGLRRGCQRNGAAARRLLPPRDLGPGTGALGSATAQESPGEVFALPAASSPCSVPELGVSRLKTSVLSPICTCV